MMIILFFYTLPLNGAAKNNLHNQKTVLNKQKESISQAKIKDLIETNLYNLSYSQSYIEKRDALNFLSDNALKALPLLKESLSNKELSDLTLLNIWALIQYAKDLSSVFSQGELESILEIQKEKPPFVYQVLYDVNPFWPELVFNNIKKMINNPDVKLFTQGFKLIQNLKINTLNQELISMALSTKNAFRLELILGVLKHSSFNEDEIKKLPSLLSFFKSPIRQIRLQLIELFKNYPQFFSQIRAQIKDTDNYIELDALIALLEFYPQKESTSFLLKLIDETPSASAALKALRQKTLNSKQYRKIEEIYKSADSYNIRENIINFLIVQKKNKKNSKKTLEQIENILKKISENNETPPNLIEKILHSS
jgi:hypothetical protein